MFRTVTLSAFALLLAIAGASAQDNGQATPESEKDLPSIAEEAAISGDGEEADGTERSMEALEESENTDGCEPGEDQLDCDVGIDD